MSEYSIFFPGLNEQLMSYIKEDGLERLLYVNSKHSNSIVETYINWKSNVVVSGMPLIVQLLEIYFKSDSNDHRKLLELEGKKVVSGEKTRIALPFNLFLTLERTVLNLLHRLCSVSTTTSLFAEKARAKKIAILDTRKTTPGLRSLERYAVSVGGGRSHRQDFADCLMIKDNQKAFFGNLKSAWEFYQNNKGFYQPVIVEIHNMNEYQEAISLGVKNVMLDNFSPDLIRQAVNLKPKNMTIELSGGINLQNIEQYLIEGVDAISLGCITFWPERVDISWKIKS